MWLTEYISPAIDSREIAKEQEKNNSDKHIRHDAWNNKSNKRKYEIERQM